MADKIGYTFRYDDNIIERATALPSFSEASAEDLRVLLALLKCTCDSDRETVKETACCDDEELTLSLQFWRGAGLLSLARAKKESKGNKREEQEEKGENTAKEKATKAKRALRSEDKLYESDSETLAEIIEKKAADTDRRLSADSGKDS